jgi:transposase-like protein
MCGTIKLNAGSGGIDMAKADAMTLIEFQLRFNSEENCETYLFQKRWPRGFCCSSCKHNKYYYISTRNLYECQECGHQVSLTAGTLMHKSKLPLSTWFWAIFLVVQDKRGRSALSLSQLLKLNYRTAWRLLHKIRHAMSARDANYKLSGFVEMDDAYFGAPQKGMDGRGTNKAKVSVAVATDENGNPRFVRMNVIDKMSSAEMQRVADNCITKGSKITSDGLSAYKKLSEIGYTHNSKNYYQANDDFLKWLHIIISNAKAFINGTYHGLGHEYLQSYLDEFCYRFNRRFFSNELFARLLNACLATSHFSVS